MRITKTRFLFRKQNQSFDEDNKSGFFISKTKTFFMRITKVGFCFRKQNQVFNEERKNLIWKKIII